MFRLISTDNFINKCKDGDDLLLCYGAGKQAEKVLAFLVENEIEYKLDSFIDLDYKKQRIGYEYNGKKYEVYSIKDAISKYSGLNIMILISNYKYPEVVESFKDIDFFIQNEVYAYSLMKYIADDFKELRRDVPHNLRLSRTMKIEKCIHYCWFGNKKIPEKYKMWMQSWKRYCPDYEIIEWNETNYDVYKNTYMAQAYEQKKWGFVPDYARLDIIYKYGGIYLDTDVELIANLDDLLYQDGFAGFQSSDYVALGLGFGAKKGLDLIKELRDEYEKIRFINPDGTLNMQASPRYQTEVLKRHGLKENGEYQIVCGLTILPQKFLCAKNPWSRLITKTDYTRAIHHYDASWQTDSYLETQRMMDEFMKDKEFNYKI